MRALLLVMALAWMVLVPVPALAQPSDGGADGAQYDLSGGGVSGVGGRAAHDAIVASGAIRASSEGGQAEAQAADGNAVSAADLPHATGGPDVASTEEAVTENSAQQGAAGSSVGTQAESAPDLEKLPDTGGPSPSWLGVPLLCIATLIARRICSS